jgi:hypothetical protein
VVLDPLSSRNALVSEYLTKLGYNQDMIEWATAADPPNIRCLNPELTKKFKIDLWYNAEDDQHYTLPGNRITSEHIGVLARFSQTPKVST